MKKENTIKVAQIGAGSFGRKRAESVQQCESAELVAIADVNSEAASKAAEALGVKSLDLENVLQSPDINVVTIATPQCSSC